MASLAIVVDGVEQKFPLEATAVTLGRGLESDIRLKDIKASRRHCQVVKSPKGYQCVDLSSGNGTYVNGVQIKQQLLEPGDKITIGSTTIVFQDEPKAAVPKAAVPKAATGKIPAAPAAAAAPHAKTAPIKIATERVQVAPTRKATARVEPAKSASQGALKPASAAPPPGKSGTRMQKAGARTGGTRPPRPAPDAPKKKGPGVLIAVAAVVVLALGVGGWLLFGSKDNGDQVRAQIDQLVKKAAEAEKAEKIDAAIADYKKAYELCQGDRFKVPASEIQKQMRLLEARRGGGGTPVKPDPKDAPEKGPDFQARRTEISEKRKLADGAAADWGGALKDWRDFLKGKPGDAKAKAEAEVQALLGKAKEDLARFRKKADALAQENKMAEACDLLKQQLPRFEGADLAELHQELEAAIKQNDK